jgi:formylglycine-generating enzyme required for sulfatase activity
MNHILKRSRAGLILALTFLVTAGPLAGQEPAKPKPSVTPASAQQLEKAISLEIGPGQKVEMVLIEAGTFTMGATESDARKSFADFLAWWKDRRDSPEPQLETFLSRTPQHRVTISKPFYMGRYEVTQAQWESVVGSNPSFDTGDSLPVEMVSWKNCVDFCRRLNAQSDDGWEYRLPTEAEWEYACRAGATGDDASGDIDEMGWHVGNAEQGCQPVGLKRPNAWGLHDMRGNVWEWCSDWFGEYSSQAATDPTGPSSGSYHVARGGAYLSPAVDCRAVNRAFQPYGYRHIHLGFRLVRARK